MAKFILLFFFTSVCAFSQERVKFAAKIQNRNSDTLIMQRVDMDGLQYKIFRAGMVSDAEGNFGGSFTLEPGLYLLFDSKEYATVYLESGYDLKMEMDAKMFDETISFKGRGAPENNYLAKKYLLIEKAKEKISQNTDKSHFKTIEDDAMDKLHSDLENEGFSKNFRKVMKR